MNINTPFGGTIMIMGGYFLQLLPVIQKVSKGQMILACIIRSQLWATIKILHLRQNMRSIHDHEFPQFLMRIGDGNESAKEDDMVKMPDKIVIPWEGESSIKKLIQHTFPQLENHGWDASYMVKRAILTPKNCDVHMLNGMIINKFPGDEHILLSFDEVEGDTHNLYQHEYLHTIAPGTLPPHILKIKIGALLMLLRNIEPKFGLCNGTRLLCRGFFMNLLDVEILTGYNIGKISFLPRIKLKTTDGAGLPFVLIKKQFPVKLNFAITINKSQGQIIPNVGIYLPQHVFSHRQLYVALSRGVSRAATRVLIKDGKVDGEEGDFTKNIVFKEILLSQP